jgi:DNA polymerase III subunit chi
LNTMSPTIIYFVETKTEEQLLALCQWVDYFYEEGKRIQIVASSSAAAQHLDHLLWTFAQSSFIPHRISSSTGSSPGIERVIITTEEVAVKGATVLISDGPVGLDFMRLYEYVVHFVFLDDPEKRHGSRSLWQTAREEGMQVNHVAYAPKGKPFPLPGKQS